MAQLNVGGRAFDAPVVKIARGQEGKALSAMTRDGRENVAFKIGGDTYVASSKDLDVKGLKAWDEVRLGEQVGHVLDVNHEVLTGASLRMAGIVGTLVGAVGMVTMGGILSTVFKMAMSVGEFGLFAGFGAVAFGGIGLGWAALTRWWNGKQAERDVLGKFNA